MALVRFRPAIYGGLRMIVIHSSLAPFTGLSLAGLPLGVTKIWRNPPKSRRSEWTRVVHSDSTPKINFARRESLPRHNLRLSAGPKSTPLGRIFLTTYHNFG